MTTRSSTLVALSATHHTAGLDARAAFALPEGGADRFYAAAREAAVREPMPGGLRVASDWRLGAGRGVARADRGPRAGPHHQEPGRRGRRPADGPAPAARHIGKTNCSRHD